MADPRVLSASGEGQESSADKTDIDLDGFRGADPIT